MAQQLLDAVDRAVEGRWTAAQERARSMSGDRDARVAEVTEAIRRELAVAGAASGGAAAVPGIGVGAAAATFVVEIGWSTVRLTDLILTIAAIHGHDRAGVEERRLWVLSILTYRDGAAAMVTQLAEQLAASRRSEGRSPLSSRSLQRINMTIGRALATRYGARRGAAAMARLVPLGVGAALGYGINRRLVTLTAEHAHAFFSQFPIGLEAIDVDATVNRRPVEPHGSLDR
ncbi:EcsC family protein [Ilumatobacter sp.]|uniref:EcsC family protein n=1 Tax=Ilumatobacter sp. TaxID=1967498 RepID=UPI003B5184FA